MRRAVCRPRPLDVFLGHTAHFLSRAIARRLAKRLREHGRYECS